MGPVRQNPPSPQSAELVHTPHSAATSAVQNCVPSIVVRQMGHPAARHEASVHPQVPLRQINSRPHCLSFLHGLA